MLFTMSMIVVLHEVLLMVILPILLPLIKEGFLLIKMIPLFDWLAQKPKCFKNYIVENPELFQDAPDLAKDFDSPICLACTMTRFSTVKTFTFTWHLFIIFFRNIFLFNIKIIRFNKVVFVFFIFFMAIIYYPYMRNGISIRSRTKNKNSFCASHEVIIIP